MKKLYKLLGIIVVEAIIGTALVGCPNPSGGNGEHEQTATYISTDSDGNRYTLAITGSTGRAARYAAQTGDRFVLTVELFSNGTYSLALTCSGTVGSAHNDGTETTLSLNVNGQPLSITISGTTMTVITGTIVLEDGDTIIAPGGVTPVVPDAPVTADVYIAGSYGAGIPCYWKNGVKTDLPLPGYNRGWTEKIFMDGNDIYVLGNVDAENGDRGAYWKNGNLTVLPGGYASDMIVSNGDIYIAGEYSVLLEDGYNYSRPCYWKNGTRIDLDFERIEGLGGRARSIALAGDVLYIGGELVVTNSYVACYWKNGIRTDIAVADAYSLAMAVSGSDVFMTGQINNDDPAWYSKNTSVYFLTGGYSVALAIAVSGNDVYVAGAKGTGESETAYYWKNGEPHLLDSGNTEKASFANGITVVNGDVYIAGQVNVFYDFQGGNSTSTACYWKNGVRIDLLDNAGTSGIFVAAKE
jgi:hypothetical protein